MDKDSKSLTFKAGLKEQVVVIELLGFFLVIVACWLTEAFDPPFSLQQVLIETVVISILGRFVISRTLAILGRVKELEGFIMMCASCKAVKLDDEWTSIEKILGSDRSLQISHGICPACHKKFQADFRN